MRSGQKKTPHQAGQVPGLPDSIVLLARTDRTGQTAVINAVGGVP